MINMYLFHECYFLVVFFVYKNIFDMVSGSVIGK